MPKTYAQIRREQDLFEKMFPARSGMSSADYSELMQRVLPGEYEAGLGRGLGKLVKGYSYGVDEIIGDTGRRGAGRIGNALFGETGRKAFEEVPRGVFDMLPFAFGPAGVPVAAANLAANTYEKTDSPLASAVAGGTSFLFPAAGRLGGRLATKTPGLNLARTEAIGSAPGAGIVTGANALKPGVTQLAAGGVLKSPVARGVEFLGQQTGYFGLGLGTQSAIGGIVAPEGQRLAAMGEAFSPENLAVEAIANLPFLGLDVPHLRAANKEAKLVKDYSQTVERYSADQTAFMQRIELQRQKAAEMRRVFAIRKKLEETNPYVQTKPGVAPEVRPARDEEIKVTTAELRRAQLAGDTERVAFYKSKLGQLLEERDTPIDLSFKDGLLAKVSKKLPPDVLAKVEAERQGDSLPLTSTDQQVRVAAAHLATGRGPAVTAGKVLAGEAKGKSAEESVVEETTRVLNHAKKLEERRLVQEAEDAEELAEQQREAEAQKVEDQARMDFVTEWANDPATVQEEKDAFNAGLRKLTSKAQGDANSWMAGVLRNWVAKGRVGGLKGLTQKLNASARGLNSQGVDKSVRDLMGTYPDRLTASSEAGKMRLDDPSHYYGREGKKVIRSPWLETSSQTEGRGAGRDIAELDAAKLEIDEAVMTQAQRDEEQHTFELAKESFEVDEPPSKGVGKMSEAELGLAKMRLAKLIASGKIVTSAQVKKFLGLTPGTADISAGGGFWFNLGKYDPEKQTLGKFKQLPKNNTVTVEQFVRIGRGTDQPLKQAEVELLKTLVPEAFVGNAVNMKTLYETLPGREPVSTVTYGQEGQVSAAKMELDKMTHEWFDAIKDRDMKDAAAQHIESMRFVNENDLAVFKSRGYPDAFGQKLTRYIDLARTYHAEPRNDGPRATSYYNTISPFDTKKYPVVRVDVALPNERHVQGDEENFLWRQDALHENLPNTLGWAMVQFVPGKNGETVAFVGEQQSRWGQARQKHEAGLTKRLETAKQKLAAISAQIDRLPQNSGERTPLLVEEGQLKNYVDGLERDLKGGPAQHPLLDFQHELVLKAVIREAAKRGVKKVVLSDGETAMMTEGHDTIAAAVTKMDVVALGEDPQYLTRRFGSDWKEGTYVKFNGYTYRVDKPQQNSNAETIQIATELVPYAQGGNYVPQAGGMRLHYDPDKKQVIYKTGQDEPVLVLTDASRQDAENYIRKQLGSKNIRPAGQKEGGEYYVQEQEGTLPTAMRSITGQKGERVEMGVHKNAIRGDEFNIPGRPAQASGSPVFRDAAGKRKTLITGTEFDISGVKMTEAGSGRAFDIPQDVLRKDPNYGQWSFAHMEPDDFRVVVSPPLKGDMTERFNHYDPAETIPARTTEPYRVSVMSKTVQGDWIPHDHTFATKDDLHQKVAELVRLYVPNAPELIKARKGFTKFYKDAEFADLLSSEGKAFGSQPQPEYIGQRELLGRLLQDVGLADHVDEVGALASLIDNSDAAFARLIGGPDSPMGLFTQQRDGQKLIWLRAGNEPSLRKLFAFTHELNGHYLKAMAESGKLDAETTQRLNNAEQFIYENTPEQNALVLREMLSMLPEKYAKDKELADALLATANDPDEVMANISAIASLALVEKHRPGKWKEFFTWMPKPLQDLMSVFVRFGRKVAESISGLMFGRKMGWTKGPLDPEVRTQLHSYIDSLYAVMKYDNERVAQARQALKLDMATGSPRDFATSLGDGLFNDPVTSAAAPIVQQFGGVVPRQEEGNMLQRGLRKGSKWLDNTLLRRASAAIKYPQFRRTITQDARRQAMTNRLIDQVLPPLGMYRKGNELRAQPDNPIFKVAKDTGLNDLKNLLQHRAQKTKTTVQQNIDSGDIPTKELLTKIGSADRQQMVREAIVRQEEVQNKLTDIYHLTAYEKLKMDYMGVLMLQDKTLTPEQAEIMSQQHVEGVRMSLDGITPVPVEAKPRHKGDVIANERWLFNLMQQIETRVGEFRNHPEFITHRRFGSHAVRVFRKDGSYYTVDAQSQRELDKWMSDNKEAVEKGELRPQMLKRDKTARRVEESGLEFLEQRIVDKREDAIAGLIQLGIDHDVASEFTQNHFNVADEVRKELAARQMPSSTPHRKLVEGYEELDTLFQQVEFMQAMIRGQTKGIANAEMAARLRDPRLEATPEVREAIKQAWQNTQTPDARATRAINNAAYLMYMTLHPLNMLQDMVQPLTGALPAALINEGAGIGETFSGIMRAMKDAVGARDNKPFNPKGRLTKDEHDILTKFQKENRGLASFSDMESNEALRLENQRRAAKGLTSATIGDLLKSWKDAGILWQKNFHKMFTNFGMEASMLASYRHFRKKGLSVAEAEKSAFDMASVAMDSLGRGGRAAGLWSADKMQGVPALLTALQTYAFHQMGTWKATFERAIGEVKGLTKEDKTAAWKALGTHTALMTAQAGVLGLPLVGVMLALVDKMFGINSKEEIARAIQETAGSEDSYLVQQATLHGLVNAMGGIDYASRAQTPGVLGLNARDGFSPESLLGPTYSIVENLVGGLSEAAQGEVGGGLARAVLPNNLRRVSQAWRDEWEFRRKDGSLIDESTPAEQSVYAVLGLKPSRIASLQERDSWQRADAEIQQKERAEWVDQIAEMLQEGDNMGAKTAILKRVADRPGESPQAVASAVAERLINKTSPKDTSRMPGASEGLNRTTGLPSYTMGEVERLGVQDQILRQLGLGLPPGRGAMKRATLIDQVRAQQPWLSYREAQEAVDQMTGQSQMKELLGAEYGMRPRR